MAQKRNPTSNLIDSVFDVRIDWRWHKLKITIDPTGRMTSAYGKQRWAHTFAKANKTGTCLLIEQTARRFSSHERGVATAQGIAD